MKARKLEVDGFEYDGICSKCDTYLLDPVIIKIGSSLYESSLCKACMKENQLKIDRLS